MGFQSGINAMLGTVAGAAFGISKTLEDRQKQATVKATEQKQAKKKQRRNFSEYLKNVPIAGGGTVGQLPVDKQRAIAKQYSKSERKALMDKMDKESNK